MDAKIKALEAELVVARLEVEFVAAKQSEGGADRPLRAKLEKARREYREKWRIPTGVQPATVNAAAKSEGVGG